MKVDCPYAYHLNLPNTVQVHPVRQVSLLSPSAENPVTGQLIPLSPPVEINNEIEFEVDKLLDIRRRSRGLQYLVQSTGYLTTT